MAEKDPIKGRDRPSEEAEAYERAVREGADQTSMPPPDRPHAAGRWGTTAAEQRSGTPPRERDDEIVLDPGELEPADDGPGRPISEKGGAHAVDRTKAATAEESTDEDPIAPAEEASLRAVEEERPADERSDPAIAEPDSETAPRRRT